MSTLHRGMSVKEFNNGYFYVTELRAFARDLGITVGNFRKFELEELIREFLQMGKVHDCKPPLPRKAGIIRDELKVNTIVTNYVGDKETKTFLLDLVNSLTPGLRPKSGQWYWLNDWRRNMQQAQECFTYGDLAAHLHTLMQTEGRLPRCPSALMNNFITDFMEDPSNAGTSRKEVLKAWEWLKKQSGPKTYNEFLKLTHPIAPEGSTKANP